MNVVVDGRLSFAAEACPAKLLAALEHRLSFPNPEHQRRARAGRSTRGLDETVCAVEVDGAGVVRLPRGAVGALRELARAQGVQLAFEDRRARRAPLALRCGIELRPYQRDAVAAICMHLQGVIVVATGGGKTTIGAAAIATHQQPTLVITHTRELVEQWRSAARSILGVEPAVATGGRLESGPVTIATVQTLARASAVDLDALGAQFGCVVVDECHRAPARMFRQVLEHMPARLRIGLTATPEREDGMTPLLGWVFGDTLYRLDHDALFEAGYLRKPRARVVHTDFAYAYGGPGDRAAMLDALVGSETRNELVAALVAAEARAGRTVLVLSDRVGHCHDIVERVHQLGVPAAALVGPVHARERARILDEFRSGVLKVVAATSLADEGLDVPRLSRLVLAFPGRARGRVVQRIGRLMRPHPDKHDAVVFDVVDLLVPPLVRAYRARREAYATLVESITPFAPADARARGAPERPP
mgnify:CR=1 FL=1